MIRSNHLLTSLVNPGIYKSPHNLILTEGRNIIGKANAGGHIKKKRNFHKFSNFNEYEEEFKRVGRVSDVNE